MRRRVREARPSGVLGMPEESRDRDSILELLPPDARAAFDESFAQDRIANESQVGDN